MSRRALRVQRANITPHNLLPAQYNHPHHYSIPGPRASSDFPQKAESRTNKKMFCTNFRRLHFVTSGPDTESGGLGIQDLARRGQAHQQDPVLPKASRRRSEVHLVSVMRRTFRHGQGKFFNTGSHHWILALTNSMNRRYYSLGDRASVMFFQSNSELSLGRTLSRIGTAASNRSFNGVNPNDHSTPYLGRLNTPHSLSTGPSGSPLSATFPYSFSIFHPRKRPRYIPRKSSKRRGKAPMRQIRAESTDISETNTDNDVYIRGRRSRYTSEQFVPRLGKDRRTMHRMSRWTAPSLDEQMSPIFSPVNRQITLFCFGFLIPFCEYTFELLLRNFGIGRSLD